MKKLPKVQHFFKRTYIKVQKQNDSYIGQERLFYVSHVGTTHLLLFVIWTFCVYVLLSQTGELIGLCRLGI
jgi:hypothetical protein